MRYFLSQRRESVIKNIKHLLLKPFSSKLSQAYFFALITHSLLTVTVKMTNCENFAWIINYAKVKLALIALNQSLLW